MGSNTGHYPRHAKRYRDFAAENARLQKERIAAFAEFAGDVKTGAYPEPRHEVGITRERDAKLQENAFIGALITFKILANVFMPHLPSPRGVIILKDCTVIFGQ